MKPPLFATLSALLVVFACNSMASEAENTLRQYCNESKGEYESRVSVGAGTRVHFNQVGFSYIKNQHSITPSELFVKQHIIDDAGVSTKCAEYLMSKVIGSHNNSNLLARVYFAFDSSELTSQSRYIVDQILTKISHAGNLDVEGHTDSVGSDAYNFSLGARRSAKVANYLIQKGLSPQQINATSKGETMPIADNQNSSERYLNRRVEIRQ